MVPHRFNRLMMKMAKSLFLTMKREKGNRSNVLGTTSVSGAKGYPVDVATVIRDNVPVNWKLDPDYSVPATTTVYDGAQLWVPVVHDSKTINPGDDEQTQDMFKTVTRTINVHKPDGSTQRTLQEVHFSRSKTVDAVTNTVVTYGDWTLVAGSASDWAHFAVPQLSGYTSYVDGQAGKDVAEQVVTPDTADVVVEVTYQPIDNQHHDNHGGQDKPTVPDKQHHDQGNKTPAVHHENQVVNNSQPAQEMKVAQPATREAQASKQLPQTGNENQAAIAGLGLVGLTLMLGLDQRKQRD